MESALTIAEKVLGVKVSTSVARFNEPGWWYQGETPIFCSKCSVGSFLHSIRKDYDSNGKTYKYWCLVCTSCKIATDLEGFESADKKILRSWDADLSLKTQKTPHEVFNKSPFEVSHRQNQSANSHEIPTTHLPKYVTVLEAARAELKSLQGRITIIEIGNASIDGDPTQRIFRVNAPTRDLSDLPAAELFLSTHREGEAIKVAEVLSSGKRSIVLRAEQVVHDYTKLILFAKSDPTVVIKGLIVFLEGVSEPALSEVLIDGGPLNSGSAMPHSELNLEQSNALGAMISPGVSLVWGPPGTGKTRVIGAAVAHFLSKGESVALVSNTNVAVDQALLQVCKDAPEFKPGEVLRLGNPSLARVTEHPYLIASRAASFLSDELNIQLHELNKQLQALNSEFQTEDSRKLKEFSEVHTLDEIKLLKNHRNDLLGRENVQKDLNNNKILLAESISAASDIGHTFDMLRIKVSEMVEHAALINIERKLTIELTEFENLQSELNQLSINLKAAADFSFLKRRKSIKDLTIQQLRVADSERLKTATIDSLRNEIQEFNSQGIFSQEYIDVRELQNEAANNWEIAKLKSVIADSNLKDSEELLLRISKISELTTNELETLEYVDSFGSEGSFELKLEALTLSARERRVEEAKIVGEIEKLHSELNGLAEKLIAKAHVVGTTLAQLFLNHALIKRKFDHVIIDEVSAALPIMVCGAMAKATLGSTLVGDFEQNGPISNVGFQMRDQLSDGVLSWLETHSFERFGINSAGSAESKQGCMILTRQYRFGPQTMELANRIAYGSLLESGKPWEGNEVEGPEITIIDTGSLESAALSQSGINGKGSWWAVGSAAALSVAELHSDKEVGIVTPYRDQMRMTRAWLGDRGIANAFVGTAHAFQGQEFPVVLVDLVEDGSGRSWVAKGNRNGSKFTLDGVRLFNVATTRNAGKLYILCNLGSITAARSGPLHELGEMYRQEKLSVLNVEELIGNLPDGLGIVNNPETARNFDSGLNGATPHFEILDDRSFYHSFEEDLLSCRKKVVIYSPFVAANRISKLLPNLRIQHERGVEFNIYTKASRELNNPDLLKELSRAGFKLTERLGMHEKLVVIDQRITYLGSLNILSNNGGTTEVMFRFEGEDFARQALRSLEPPFQKRAK